MTDLILYFNWLFEFSLSQNLLPQIILIYTLFLIIKSKNIFYSLLYVFIQLLFFGIFIAYYQMEFYTGFLWVAEFSIVLVFLILLIYLNTDGYIKYNYFLTSIKFSYFVLIAVFFSLTIKVSNITMPYDFLFDFNSLWDDYYEALNNVSINDFNGVFNSYYVFNSFELLLFAFLLLFGTLLCVSIYKSFFTYKSIPYSSFFSVFNYFSLKINFNFLRQQNLHSQTSVPASNKIMKKK